ncbi:hypothetical protein M407DRAFT_8444 [Tulasnella calospora MUT 4182]|uniref:Uncharacterized protein n=1 Tax=Tulasnella calospora MUT 4182 TaxID=1051891 RepID=A0A0C3LVK2_9AGAM|nr:hypothetical protein M407DRAFT_8444 [Tulasnella calospora MUT 4182]
MSDQTDALLSEGDIRITKGIFLIRRIKASVNIYAEAPALLVQHSPAMAEEIPGTRKHKIRTEAEAQLTGWLKQIQKEQPVSGDKRIRSDSYEGFESLSEKVNDLGHKFEEFMRAIRPIGASSGLIAISKKLREGIKGLLQEFGSNSAKIWTEFSLETGSIELPGKLKDVSKREFRLPEMMEDLAEDLRVFFNGLCAIPEFSDGRLTDALVEFHEWLLYRAECIASHIALRQVGPSTIRQYISRVMTEMGDYVSKVGSALSDFAHAVLLTLNCRQESPVYEMLKRRHKQGFRTCRPCLKTVVITLWISSLILSVASAINSQLAMHWRAAMYRSPRSVLPFWVSMCFDYVPLGCLVGAVLAFSVGLVVWTIAAELGLAVKISAATITGATFLVLFIIIGWEAMEWLRNKQDRADVEPLARIHALLYTRQPGAGDNNTTEEEGNHPREKISAVKRGLLDALRGICHTERLDPTDASAQQKRVFGRVPAGRRIRFAIQLSQHDMLCTGDLSEALGGDDGIQDEGVTAPPGERAAIAGQRFRRAVECLMTEDYRHFRAFILAQNPKSPHNLRTIQPVHQLWGFHPPGHDIHFSPDEKYLAVSQLNGIVRIWAVDKFGGEAEMALPNSGGRFAWSPDSSRVLIIEKTGLSIWELNTQMVKGSYLPTDEIKSITWLQSSSQFIAVINNELHIYSTPEESAWALTKTQVKRPQSARRECWLMTIELGIDKQQRRVAAAPILAKARHLCVSSNGQFALVSYRDGDPPELWRLRSQSGIPQLVFRGRFFTPQTLEKSENTSKAPTVSGKARFCGESDKWVMATDGKSNIYIWDRVSRQLLHTLKGSQIKEKFKHFSGINTITSARKDSQGGLLIVSECTEGGVVIWEESAAQAESKSD